MLYLKTDFMKKIYLLLFFGSLSFLSFGQVTIWSEDFNNPADDGVGAIGPGPSISAPASGKWTVNVDNCDLSANTDWYMVNNSQLEARDVDGTQQSNGSGSGALWTSESIDITGYADVSISVDVLENGTLEHQDFAKASYQIDGGVITQFGFNYDDFTSVNYSISALSGSSLVIYLEADNNADAEYISFDNAVVMGGTADPEPSNHISSFLATTNGVSQIDLSWNDNDGAQAAAGVLILANTSGTFTNPVDGVAQNDDNDWSDGEACINIAHSIESYNWAGLAPSTTFYFKAFTYTNSGANIDYKTNATVPTANATTDIPTAPQLIISEVADPDDVANSRFVELYNAGSSIIDLDQENWYLTKQTNGVNYDDKKLSGKIYPGETYVTSYSSPSFNSSYHFNPEDNSGFQGNGDDGYFLYKGGDHSNGNLIDAFGVPDEDGSGTAWDYEDSQAKRKASILIPNATWTATEWDISDANVADMTPGTHHNCVGWSGSSSNDWNTATNWSGGMAPIITQHMKIPTGCGNYPTLSASVSIVNLFFLSQSGADASLIGANHLSISGTAYFERYVDDYTNSSNGWHFLSSPVQSFAISGSDFEPGVGVDDLYRWGETNNSWLNYVGGTFGHTHFETGLGYLIAYDDEETKLFTGSNLHTSSVSKSLSYTAGQGHGWNLIGNPYSSAIDWDLLSKTGEVNASVYLIKGSDGSYISYNGSTGDVLNGEIPAMQGFFVKAESAGQSITMETTDQVHSNNVFWKDDEFEETLKVSLRGDSSVNNTYFQFRDDATNAFDTHCDAYKLFGFAEIAQIYSTLGETKYAINCLPHSNETVSVPMGLHMAYNEDLNLDFSGLESFYNDISIHLEDKKTNNTIDIRQNQSYSFTAEVLDEPNRFVLHFNGINALNEFQDQKEPQVFAYHQAIYIESNEILSADILVYNINGQLISKHKMVDKTMFKLAIDMSQAVYLVSIRTDHHIWNKKVYVQ